MVRLKVPPGTLLRTIFPSFQFHMVRLKESPHPIDGKHQVISIPYGAIKRFQLFVRLMFSSAFQFHMVRLKAEAGLPHAHPAAVHFNSIWCD